MTLTVGLSAGGTRLTVTLLDGQAGLRLRGEVDMLSADALRQAIEALPADVGEVHLELAELTFIDVGGTRELLALARRPARPRLILHQPPCGLLRLIHLLWPSCSQAPVPSNDGAGQGATVSISSA
ncbi:MAG TPA: STAS domain-containing protein [Streptosporangiaceae bacterium]|jgi:ABC-type transporter Mla MlaB component